MADYYCPTCNKRLMNMYGSGHVCRPAPALMESFTGFDKWWYHRRMDNGQLPCSITNAKQAAQAAYAAALRAAGAEAAQDRAELRALRKFKDDVDCATNDLNYQQ